ncbi:MAG: putative metal-binding motif-containing protein [Myxococcota bacterium]|nr:putative metal-binding motif-containing protein [Myxococcota bacterium]
MDAGPLCESNASCDDGLFCNGMERCAPGAEEALPNGCVPGESPCAEDQICDDEADRCTDADCAGGGDGDRDGDPRPECGGTDCDDTDPTRFRRGAVEVCDPAGVDEDCDVATISGEDDGDRDGDGFVDDACFNRREDGGENRGRDCDDRRGDANPDGAESCNGFDDDCDGRIDEGVQLRFYRDIDGDGFGCEADPMLTGCSEPSVEACTAPLGYTLQNGDCDDTRAARNPGAAEMCNGVDDDCNGEADPATCGCIDGVSQDCGPPTTTGICTRSSRTCVAGMYPSSCPGAVYPEATDPCGGGDEDCDGRMDEDGVQAFYFDADGDGHGDVTRRMEFCPGLETTGYVSLSDDCDDTTATVAPSLDEARYPCDTLDNDCDGTVDEAGTDELTCYRDVDGDGYGSGVPVSACSCPGGHVARGGDCVDNASTLSDRIHPGARYEAAPHCGGRAPPCGAPSWDYDCSGAVEPHPTSSCRMSGPFCVGSGTQTTHKPAECGSDVAWTRCALLAGGCSPRPDGTRPLTCR